MEGDPEIAREEATRLVALAGAAGVDSNLTVDKAEALYGESAESVCNIFDDGLNSAESLLVTGNPSGRRAKLTTEDSAEYGRLVVRVYCPEHLDTYDGEIEDLRLAGSD